MFPLVPQRSCRGRRSAGVTATEGVLTLQLPMPNVAVTARFATGSWLQAPEMVIQGLTLQVSALVPPGLTGPPVAHGLDSAVAGNTNQWLAGTAAGGAMTIPLTVQYVRTTGAPTPGTVKGLATFTMSYK